jgi:hypothetical protein
MSITLKRPMFRMGGKAKSEDTGITSGLRQGYKNGDLAELLKGSSLDPRLVGIGSAANFYNMFPKTIEKPVASKPLTIDERLNELAKAYDVSKEDDFSALISGIGSGFSGAYTLGEALNKTNIARNQIINDKIQKAREIKTKLALLPIENELLKELEKAKSKESDKQKSADAVRSIYDGRIKEIENQIVKANTAGDSNKVIELGEKRSLLKRERDDAILRINTPGSTKSERILNLAEALIKSGNATEKNASEKAKKIYKQIESGEDASFAKGGSVGNKNMQMQNTKTSSQLTMEEENEASVDMPYESFRARIPSTVPDDIVQLIYYNKSAFTDFANIQAQRDVYDFNNKYNVQLVLPMQTQTT